MNLPKTVGDLDKSFQWGDFHSFLEESRMIVEDGSFVSFVPIELSDFFSP
jgi:hypothetical protein